METKEIITTLFYTGLQAHVFHLQTTSYAEHMALGGFYEAVQGAADAWAEALIGSKNGKRPDFATSIELQNYKEGVSTPFVTQFADWLVRIGDLPTDILNMRDDLLGVCHKTLYLLSLDGNKKAPEEQEPMGGEMEEEATEPPEAETQPQETP